MPSANSNHTPTPSVDESVDAFLALLDSANTAGRTDYQSGPQLKLSWLEPTICEGANSILASFSEPTSLHILDITEDLTDTEKTWIADTYPLFTRGLQGAQVEGETEPKSTGKATRNAWETAVASISQEAYRAYAAQVAADKEASEQKGLLGKVLGMAHAAIGLGGSDEASAIKGTTRRHTGDTPAETEIVGTYSVGEDVVGEDKKSLG